MAGTPLKIIVGLGNPGPEHLLTRHNAGFWFVDALAAKAGARFRPHTKFQGDICRTQLSGSEVTLLKPMTYMNRSGLAIRALCDYLKVQSSEVLVVHDELDLPVGEVRFKFGGGAGGHNGLRDTITARISGACGSASGIRATSRRSSITSCGARRRVKRSDC